MKNVLTIISLLLVSLTSYSQDTTSDSTFHPAEVISDSTLRPTKADRRILSDVGDGVLNAKGNIGSADIYGTRIFKNLAELRRFNKPRPGVQYWVAEKGKQGWFEFDESDITTIENMGTVIVSQNGKRFKRVYTGIAELSWFGGKGDGLTDNSSILSKIEATSIRFSGGIYRIAQKTTLANKTIILEKDAFLLLENELILDNCNISYANPRSIYGTGKVRGVITNSRVPVELFGCHFNILTKNDRSDFVQSGDLYIDPLLGNDANTGLSANASLRSFSAGLAKIKTLVTQGRSSDLLIILRGGRYEFDSTSLITASHSIPSKKVTFRANIGDKVQFSPVLEYYNSWATAADVYKTHKAFTHTIASPFINLYRADTGEEIEIANSITQFGVVSRNNQDSIKLAYVNAKPIASIYAPTELKTTLDAMPASEVSNVYIIAKQWFTSQWARVSEYAKSNGEIKYKLDDNLVSGDYLGYVNGYYHYTKNRAPFYVGNVKSYATDQQFFTTPTLVYLPKQDGVYFTSRKELSTLIRVASASRIVFEGIEFAYVSSSDKEMISNYMAGMNTNTVINADNADDVSVLSCTFRFNNIANIYIKGNRFQVKKNRFESLGGGGAYVVGNAGNVSYNHIYDINKLMLHQPGLVMDGAGDTTSYNVVDKMGYIGIRLANLPAMTQTHICFRNIVRNVGCTENGQLDETRSLLDGGAMYVFGRNPATSHVNTEIFENVIYNVYSEKEYRGIFYDDGVAGTYTHDNLIFNVGSYTLDLRQVNDRTKGNRMARNILAGPIRYTGLAADPASNVFEATNVILSTKNGIYSNTLSALSQYAFQKLDYNVGKDVLYIQPDELKALGINIPAFIKTFIAPYTSNAASSGGGSVSSYYNVKSYNLQGDGIADDAAALTSLLATIGSEKVDMVFSKGTYVFNSNVTLPTNVKVRMDNGAVIAPGASAVVTILGEVVSALNPIVGGNGLVYLKGNGVIYPEWYGANAGNSASDYLAFKRMVNVFGSDPVNVYLTKGTYALASTNYSKNPAMTGDANNDGVANDYFGSNSSYNGITKTFSVTTDGQKIDYTSSTAQNDWVAVKQNNMPVTPGQTYTVFTDTKFIGSGYSAMVYLQYVNATGTVLGDAFTETKTSSTAFTTLKLTTTAPAGAVYANITLRMNTRVVGQTGSVWFKNTYFVSGTEIVTNFDPITVPLNFILTLSSLSSIGVPANTAATLNAKVIAPSGQPSLQIEGSLNGKLINPGLVEEKAIKTVSSAYTIVATEDNTIIVDATSAAIPIYLPDATTCKGSVFLIKKIDSSSSAVTLTATNAQLIDGAATQSIMTQYGLIRVQSDGSKWIVL